MFIKLFFSLFLDRANATMWLFFCFSPRSNIFFDDDAITINDDFCVFCLIQITTQL